MNIEILQDCIFAFKREVIESGFKRNLDDYSSSLPASQNNIVALRGIAGEVLSVLDQFYGGDLPENLSNLLPSAPVPFTADPHHENFRTLIEDTEITQQPFFDQLSNLLTTLRGQIRENEDHIEEIESFIQPYISDNAERIASDGLAMLSIVFNEREMITNLNKFTKTLKSWNQILPIYHQLLKSESPKDVEIVGIQNGCIDIVVNLDIDIALDFVELFRLGFSMFTAYLSYKQITKHITSSYFGNSELISQESDREKLMLKNIGIAVRKQIKEQHKKAKKKDKTIDNTAIPKKAEQVAKLITSHILKGNDIKLLALPEREDIKEEDRLDHIETLRKQSVNARQLLRQTTSETRQMLLEVYGTLGNNTEEEETTTEL